MCFCDKCERLGRPGAVARLGLLAWCTAFVLSPAGQSAARGDGTAESLFATEYRARREAAAAHPKSRPQLAETTWTEREDGAVVDLSRFVVRRNGESFLVMFERLADAPPVRHTGKVVQYCSGYNGLYYFELDKDDAGRWGLKNLLLPPPDYAELHKSISTPGVVPLIFPKMNPKASGLPERATFSPRQDKFDNLPLSPGYKLRSVRPADAGGTRVRVDYVSEYNDAWIFEPTPAECSVVFDRSRYWAVLTVSKRIPSHGLEWDYRAEYQPDEDFPVLARAVVSVWSNHPGRKRSETTTVKTTRFEGEPLDAISLSAFGLPEPPGIVWEQPTPTHVWLLSAAGVMAAVGLLVAGIVRWRRRRSQSALPG